MPVSGGGAGGPLKYLSRVEKALRVEGRFQLPMQREPPRADFQRQKRALGQADAVFAGDGPAQRQRPSHQRVNGAFRGGREPAVAVEKIHVQVAVPGVAIDGRSESVLSADGFDAANRLGNPRPGNGDVLADLEAGLRFERPGDTAAVR